MSLTKLFNKNYFVQNILKSKAVIALVIGIIPILNAIFLMAMSSNAETPIVADLTVLSVLNIIGMYVLPIVLSLCLFGYVFKKKSVDFINSMPLTRKTIYITNSMGGILLIIVMMLISALLLCIESLIFSNLIIPFAMILDYFIIWTVAYIFVFTVANIATSISGNHVTMLVVTAVILFLVPFMHNYITGFNGNMYGRPYYVVDTAKVVDEDVHVDLYLEKLEEDVDYTLPYNYISLIFKGDVTTYSLESIIKMLILSVVYFFVGMYLFEKRKMEVNETSFKSNNTHMIVKSLTLLPIGIFAIALMDDISSFMVNLFIFGLIIAYCFIYDLITSKAIRNLKLGAIYFVATAVVCVGLYYGVEHLTNAKNQMTDIKVEDITSVACYIDEIDYTNKYVDNKMNGVYLDNQELLKIIRENIRDSRYRECSMRINLKLANNEEYTTDLYLETEDYNEIVDIVLSDKTYIEEYKDIDYSKVQALTVGDVTIVGEEMEQALVRIQEILAGVNLKEAYELPNIYTTIDLELYKNHKNISYDIPLNISEELLEDYVNASNKRTVQLTNKEFDIYDVRLFNYERTMASYYEQILDSECKSDLATYIIRNKNEQVDVTKPMLRIRLSAGYYGEYENAEYFTNNVVEFIEIANNKVGGDIDE